MSSVNYSYSSDNTGGSISVTWDDALWQQYQYSNYDLSDKASKADIMRLEAEIRDLRKVLTELMEILGGRLKGESKT